MTSPAALSSRTTLICTAFFCLLILGVVSSSPAQESGDLFSQPGATPPTPSTETPGTPPTTPAAGHPSGIPLLPPNVDVPPEIVATYTQADQLMEQGEYAQALALANELLVGNERIPGFLLLKARAQTGLEQYDAAISTLSDAIFSVRGAWQLHEARGDAYLDSDQYRQAVSDYATASSLSPGNADLLHKLGIAQVRFGMELQNTDPASAYEQLSAGVDSLTRAVDMGIEDAELYSHRGIAQGELENLDEAIDDYLLAVELDPQEALYQQLLGFGYLRRAEQAAAMEPEDKTELIADYRAAMEAFGAALELVPDDPAAEAGMMEGGTDALEEEAEELYFEKFQPEAIYASRASVHNTLGILLEDAEESRQEYEAAIADSDLALELDPDLAAAFFQKGVAQRMLDDLEDAINSFTQALESSGGINEALLRRGIVWYYLGEYDLAIMDFQDMLQTNPDPRASFWIGLTEATRGNYLEAIDAYSNTLRRVPGHTLAHINRGLAYLEMGSPQRALDDFNEMIRRDQSNAAAYYYRGLALEEMDQEESAMRSFRRALYWDPDFSPAQERLGQAAAL